jgi:hypothetical protein
MHPYEYKLSFRVSHPSEDLSSLYETLGKIPDFIPGRIWKVGEQRYSVAGSQLDGTYESSYFFFSITPTIRKSTDEDPLDLMESVMTKLLPFESDLEDCTKSGGTLEFFLSVYVDSNSSVILNPLFTKSISDKKILLSIDIYTNV